MKIAVMTLGSKRWLFAWAIGVSIAVWATDRCSATAPEADLASTVSLRKNMTMAYSPTPGPNRRRPHRPTSCVGRSGSGRSLN